MRFQGLRRLLPGVVALALIASVGNGTSGYTSNGAVWSPPVVQDPSEPGEHGPARVRH